MPLHKPSKEAPPPLISHLLKPQKANVKCGIIFLFFGTLLPMAAALYELYTHYCARAFFDPLPSISYAILFGLIPLTNFLVWLSVRKDLSEHYALLTIMVGMSAGTAFLYTIMFASLMPIAIIGCLFGVGLFGLSPFFALLASRKSGNVICKLALNHAPSFDPHQTKHIGHILILAFVIAMELPSTLTRIHLDQASRPATAIEGIHWLRKYGSEDVMLRACYERSGRATDIIGSLYQSAHPIDTSTARDIFYRVTGKPFNSVPIPSSARAIIASEANIESIPLLDPKWSASNSKQAADDFDFDSDLAGEAVSGVSRGLAMTHSVMIGRVSSGSAITKFRWSFELANKSKFDREVREVILLPPKGVVTGAYLTKNGVRRPASFTARNTARKAYVSAVRSARDPLLVSTCGPDRVLVQCYPVTPNSTQIVELDIIAPLQPDLQSTSKYGLTLPTIEERNFQVDTIHQLALTIAPTLSDSTSGSEDTALNRTFSAAELSQHKAFVTLPDPMLINNCMYADETGAPVKYVTEQVRQENVDKPSHIIVLIDGSASMRNAFPTVVKSLDRLPEKTPLSVQVVSDGVLTPMAKAVTRESADFPKLIAALSKYECAGGQDNSACLAKLLYDPANDQHSVIAWVHGPQPIDSYLPELHGLWTKNKHASLYDFPVCAGPNQVLAGLQFDPQLRRGSITDSLSDDLGNLFDQFAGRKQSRFVEFGFADKTALVPGADNSSTSAVGKLALNSRIANTPQEASLADKLELANLSVKNEIVTPFTSAVLLDTKPEKKAVKSLKRNAPVTAEDMEPYVPQASPAPEADTWLLLAVVVGAFGFTIIQRKRVLKRA